METTIVLLIKNKTGAINDKTTQLVNTFNKLIACNN